MPFDDAAVAPKQQVEGFKSKRYMKEMLKQMKLGGYIRTMRLMGTKGKKAKAFGYFMPKHRSNTAAAAAEAVHR